MKNSLGIIVILITLLIYVGDQKSIDSAVRKFLGRSVADVNLGFQLRNRTREVGINHIHERSTFDPKLDHVAPYIQAVGASVSAVDLDGAGWYDLYLTTSKVGGLNQYYRNNRDGTFTEVGKEIGLADVNSPYPTWRSVFLDYDRDGLKDLILFSFCPRVFKNYGAKGFSEVFEHGLKCGVIYGGVNALEVNRSGRLSFVVSPYFRGNLFSIKTTKVFPNNFSGESNGHSLQFYEDVGGGRYRDETAKYGFTHKGWGHAVGVYDLRGNGHKDIWFPEDYNFERVYLNDGNDRFKDQGEILAKSGFGRNGMGVDIADVDNDGHPLVFVTHIYTQGYKLSGNSLWKAVDPAAGVFNQEAGARGVVDCGWAWSGRFIDFDNNGALDLFVGNGFISNSRKKNYWYTISVLDAAGPSTLEDAANWPPINDASIDGYQRSCLFQNTGDGKFVDVAANTDLSSESLDGRGTVAIDYMNNGSPSLVVTNINGETVFYANEQQNKNAWLGLKFRGTRSNRDGWGVRVVISMKDKKITRELQPLNGYASQGEDRLLIGLGANPQVKEIEVLWPSGVRQKMDGLALSRYHTIVEPSL